MEQEKKVEETKEPTLVEQPGGAVMVEEPPKDGELSKDDERSVKTGGGDTGEDDEPLGAEHDHLSPEEREALRERRREERRHRKDAQRARAAEKDRRIAELNARLEEANARLSAVERRGASADFAQLESGIEEARRVAEAAREDMKAAMAAQDAEAHTRAQEAWYAAQRRAESLAGIRARVLRAHNSQRGPSAPPPPDRAVVRQAEEWAQRNSWYDPELRDTDSRVARTIDESLDEEGWDPRTREYWAEFDARIAKYLPHRAGRGTLGDRGDRKRGSGDGDGGGSPTGGSDRSGGGAGKGFVLSADRVQAIKDAGMWDDPVKRNKMIQRFKDFDKAQTGAGKRA